MQTLRGYTNPRLGSAQRLLGDSESREGAAGDPGDSEPGRQSGTLPAS